MGPKLLGGHNKALYEALKAADIANEFTRRVVIDIPTNGVVTVYVEKYADDRMIQVITSLSGIEIKSIEDLEE